MCNMSRRRRRLLVGTLVVTAIGGAACGPSSSADPIGSDTGRATTDTTQANASGNPSSGDPMLDFQRCMAEFGIEVSPIAGQSGGYTSSYRADSDPEAVRQAEEACEPLLQELFGEFDDDPEADAARSDAQLAFRLCMADHGIDLPEDHESGSGIAAVTGDPSQVEVEGATILDVDPDVLTEGFDACGHHLQEANR